MEVGGLMAMLQSNLMGMNEFMTESETQLTKPRLTKQQIKLTTTPPPPPTHTRERKGTLEKLKNGTQHYFLCWGW